jgi:hypothetical protein
VRVPGVVAATRPSGPCRRTARGKVITGWLLRPHFDWVR